MGTETSCLSDALSRFCASEKLSRRRHSAARCASDAATVARFRDVLMQAQFVATVRKTRGDDIDAACGQLAGQVQDKTRRRERRAVGAL